MSESLLSIRTANIGDLSSLVKLEQTCFSNDRLSKRSFKHHIQSEHTDFLVASMGHDLVAYGLVLKQQGTRLARLYSLAVTPCARGKGVSKRLITELELLAVNDGRLYMRLEVAKPNLAAIALYQACGYRVFGEYHNYYEDHADALRMQKRIRHPKSLALHTLTPWYRQNTEFTCGPTALMMAMSSLKPELEGNIQTELDIWREATTIFMTSGHGGCHPFGLALAANKRGFKSSVWLNSSQPLFIDGVRSEHKKQIMQTVHQHFEEQCLTQNIHIHHQAISLDDISNQLNQNTAVLILISTYRFDGKKVPHWVVVTGLDEECLFVHDPDMDEQKQVPLDCQFVPVARADFDKMSAFGSQRLRAAVTLSLTRDI
jgi:ribosomal protein S18 acetylase RimI-like enzyme